MLQDNTPHKAQHTKQAIRDAPPASGHSTSCVTCLSLHCDQVPTSQRSKDFRGLVYHDGEGWEEQRVQPIVDRKQRKGIQAGLRAKYSTQDIILPCKSHLPLLPNKATLS